MKLLPHAIHATSGEGEKSGGAARLTPGMQASVRAMTFPVRCRTRVFTGSDLPNLILTPQRKRDQRRLVCWIDGRRTMCVSLLLLPPQRRAETVNSGCSQEEIHSSFSRSEE